MFGFCARGEDGHLILGDDNPVLCQKYRGSLVVNQAATPAPGDHRPPAGYGFGHCEITYPKPVSTQVPPMVFAVPTARSDGRGLGIFQHRGSPGNWTGFSTVITNHLLADKWSASYIGLDSGWEYRVCVFGDPGIKRSGPSNFGLALYDEDGNPTFHSNWPFVPFRGLLSSWRLNSFTRDAYTGIWQNTEYTSGVDTDNVVAKGTHSWGAKDGTLGFLLSSVGFVPVRADVGSFHHTQSCVVTLGFPDSRRDQLWSVTYYGIAQHPSANMSEINNWRILTADFTYV